MGGSSGGSGYYGGGAGSGGVGGGGGGGGGGAAGRDQCALIFNASINSLNSDYARAVNIGAILGIALGGESGRTLEVRTSEGYLIGSLIGLTNAGILVECIQAGNIYQAQVTQISSGTFSVLVTRAVEAG